MRDFGDPLNDHFATAGPRMAELLVWVRCRNRTTGTIEPVGLWTGAQAMAFDIEGETRTYYGNGAIVSDPTINRAIGLDVRLSSLVLSRGSDAVQLMIDSRDAKGAEIEIRRANFAPSTGVLIDTPQIVFDGQIDEPDARAGGIGGSDVVTLKLAPVTARLSKTLPLVYSDETGRRNGDDRIFRYAVISGQVAFYWGTKRVTS